MTPEELQVMLRVQSRAFKDCLEIFVAKYDKENAELRKTISEMERSLEFKDKQDALGESKPPPSAFEFVVQYL